MASRARDAVNVDDIRWRFGPPRGDTAWLQIGLHHLAANGRMAILLHPRVLVPGGIDGAVLQLIIRQNLLRAVVELPERSVSNSAVAPVLLLLGEGWATSRTSRSTDVLMVSAQEFADAPSTARAPLTINAAHRVADLIRSWLESGTRPESDNFNIATYDDIVDNDWVLLPNRYRTRLRPLFESSDRLPNLLRESSKRLREIVMELAQSTVEIDAVSIVRDRLAVEREHDLTRSAGEVMPLGALEDITIFRGVRNHEVVDDEVSDIAVVDPDTLMQRRDVVKYWEGRNPHILQHGDVIVSLEGPNCGDAAQFIDYSYVGDCVAAPGTAVIRVGVAGEILPGYLAAWCATSAFRQEVERLAVGSLRKRVRIQDLPAIQIIVPDHQTQQLLADRAKTVRTVQRLLPEVAKILQEFVTYEFADILQSLQPED
jgi:hypothetical protein